MRFLNILLISVPPPTSHSPQVVSSHRPLHSSIKYLKRFQKYNFQLYYFSAFRSLFNIENGFSIDKKSETSRNLKVAVRQKTRETLHCRKWECY